MSKSIRVAALVILCVLAVVSVEVDASYPPIPILCLDEPTCDCLCTNNYDGWSAYWGYGCLCGGLSWSPTCVTCSGDDENAHCVTIDTSGAGSCPRSRGRCYEWGTCTHT